MTVRRQHHCAFAVAVALSLLLAPSHARADEPAFGVNDIPTVFFISKSDDHNRVDYGMRLSASCAPLGKEPVFPYWREFERSPPVRTHTLGMFEYFAYGVSSQQLLRQGGGTFEWSVRLKRLDRPIVISTAKDATGRCVATPRTTIGGAPEATLISVYVKLKGLLKVAYLDVFGTAKEDGHALQERLVP